MAKAGAAAMTPQKDKPANAKLAVENSQLIAFPDLSL
jgi:hypothetical protein